jgi:excisionase family DNA binding protein
MLSTGQVAERIGVSTKTVVRYVVEGKFPNAVRHDRCIRIPEADVATYLEVNRASARKSA